MGDFKINEKTVFTQSGSAEPAMGSTITGIPAAGVTGVLPAGVTGGSGLTALGTVTAGDISHADIVYPKGHWNFIEKLTTMTGSGTSQYWTWTGATSLYNNYRFIFENLLVHSTRGRIYMRLLDSGSAVTSNYWFAQTVVRTTVATAINGGTGQSEWLITSDEIGGGGVTYIDVIISNLTPNATTDFNENDACIKWSGTQNGETTLDVISGGGGCTGTNTNYNGVDINMGNFYHGQVSIFGQSKY